MKTRFCSLRYRILLSVLGMSIPAMILFFAINTYAVKKIEHQIYNNKMNLMNVHMNSLDGELETASDYLVSESINKSSINQFASHDVKVRYKATMAYHVKNVNLLRDYEMIEGQIIYSQQNDNTISYFNGYDSDYQKRTNVLNYIKEHADDLFILNGQWKTFRIRDEWILLSAVGDERALFCFWTTYDSLMRPVEKWKQEEKSYFCFTNEDGEILSNLEQEDLRKLSYDGDLSSYYFSGDNDEYLMSGIESAIGDFRLMNVVEKKESLGVFPQIQILGSLILLFVLFAGIPWLIRFLNKSIFNPVDRMERGIQEVETGNLNIQIENVKSSKEMEHLIQSFNKMTTRILDLKIQTYEDELQRQKLELDYLNLQMEPHFYLNAMNFINVTAQLGDMEMICKMTNNLSQYMRYLMGNRKESVTVREELEHVGHYMEIMETRLGDNFQYREFVDEKLLTVRIPPLSIQTLVENSMKYAFDVYKETIVEVDVSQEGAFILIRVKDNGSGYPEEYLERFNSHSSPEGKHIGLMNLRSRIEMLYGKESQLRIFNVEPEGACTEIYIQMQEDEEEEKENEHTGR